MKILFIGNYQTGPGGEIADEVHITRELETLGHEVLRVNRDEWREYVIEDSPQDKYNIPEIDKVDIVIICKWHHFYDGSFIQAAKIKYNAPVFYWVWDWMNKEEWHLSMAREADLYLSGELGSSSEYRKEGVNFYYFQFDSTDIEFPAMHSQQKDYDVVFLGSCTNQNGRLDILKEINKQVPIQVFAYDYEEWRKQGFKAEPAVYGHDFNRVVAHSRIVLGTSANVNCFGYWSNRVGKVLYAGGFLLQWYTPGMELTLADCCDYFSSADEAVEKIKFYLHNPHKIDEILERNSLLNRDRFTSQYKVRQLSVLLDRFVKTRGEGWMLP